MKIAKKPLSYSLFSRLICSLLDSSPFDQLVVLPNLRELKDLDESLPSPLPVFKSWTIIRCL